MRSMYRFSVIALAVGAMALFGMAKPSHAEVKVSGVAWAGIGIHKTTPKTGDGATDPRRQLGRDQLHGRRGQRHRQGALSRAR